MLLTLGGPSIAASEPGSHSHKTSRGAAFTVLLLLLLRFRSALAAHLSQLREWLAI
jgi:hypothetical protein